MFNYRLIVAAAVGCLLTAEASARVMTINRYLGGRNTFGFYVGEKEASGVQHEATETCSGIGGSTVRPTNKICSERIIEGVNCYYNCYCPSSYSYTSSNCASPKIMSGGSCDGKYNVCSCPDSYEFDSSNCASPKILGSGECGGKYLSCTCPSEYQYNSSNCASPKVLGGGSCDDMYAACTCPSTYQYTCDGLNPVGDACDGLYESCQASSPDPDPITCNNNYAHMTGPLFDGQANTAAIMATMPDNNLWRPIAASAVTRYYPQSKVSEDDARFGKGKWWLPSVGEMMEMLGVDWSTVDADAMASRSQTVSAMNIGATDEDVKMFASFPSKGNFFTLYGKSGVPGTVISDSNLHWWTSSELDAEKVYVGYGVSSGMARIVVANKAKKGSGYSNIPITKVTLNEGQVASIGSFVDASANITTKLSSAVGMVFWISPQNPLIVKIAVVGYQGVGIFVSGTMGNIGAIYDNPWNCTGLGCPVSNNQTCTSPKVGVGTACDNKYEACQCPTNYVACDSPKEGVGEACDGIYYEACQCPTSYQYTCSDKSQYGMGEVCDGKYASCADYIYVGEDESNDKSVYAYSSNANTTMNWDDAMAYAQSMGGVLPSRNLGTWVSSNLSSVNANLQAASGQALLSQQTNYYWLSDEGTNNGTALVIRFSDDRVVQTYKSSIAYLVRAFRITCPIRYIACDSPKLGIGEACDDKYYTSCQCPASYNQTCTLPKFGIGEVCDGKYESCSADYIYVGEYNGQKVYASKEATETKTWADAVEYAQSKGGILPSIDLWQWIYDNKTVVKEELEANGGQAFNTSGSYWSSTEVDYWKAKALNMNSGQVSDRIKKNTSFVRVFQLSADTSCPVSYNQTCTSPQIGLGASCNCKYKSCASGYVKVGQYNGKDVLIGLNDADEKLMWLPAVSYVESLGGVLPDRNLLSWAFQNKSAIDATLVANSGQALSSAVYWTSTESTYNQAYCAYYNNGSPVWQNAHKNNKFLVRPFILTGISENESCNVSGDDHWVYAGEYDGQSVYVYDDNASTTMNWNDATAYAQSVGGILPDEDLSYWVGMNLATITTNLQAAGGQVFYDDYYWLSEGEEVVDFRIAAEVMIVNNSSNHYVRAFKLVQQ